MRVNRLIKVAGAAVVAALCLPVALGAQTAQSLGSITLAKPVMADGQPLAAGTYTLRVSADTAAAVVGQPAGSERWVEFVQAGKVKGRELASVVSAADVKAIAKMPPPAAGSAKVQMLKGDEYVRVWVNRGGQNYLVHLTAAK
jgi:hypothetical protein